MSKINQTINLINNKMQKSVQTKLIDSIIPLKLQYYIIVCTGCPRRKKNIKHQKTRKKRLAKHKILLRVFKVHN